MPLLVTQLVAELVPRWELLLGLLSELMWELLLELRVHTPLSNHPSHQGSVLHYSRHCHIFPGDSNHRNLIRNCKCQHAYCHLTI